MIVDRVAGRFADELSRHSVPGAVLGVYHQGRSTITPAGVRDLEAGAAVTPQTVFRLGSMTKVITALLIMRSVERGRLALDAPVVGVWPQLRLADPEAKETLTLRHLLAHRAGFYGDVFDDLGQDGQCLQRYADRAHRLERVTAPGAAFSYNNAAFVLVARLTEILTGSAWDRLFTEEIAGPLGMTRTGVLWSQLPDDVAVSHLPAGHGELAPVRGEAENRTMAPAGATPWTTAGDVLALGRLLLGGTDRAKVVLAETIAAMTALSSPGPTRTFARGWGLGVQRFDHAGRVFGHDGAVGGQLSFLRVAPEHDLVLSLLTNGGDGRGLFQSVWDELTCDWPEALVEPPPAWPEPKPGAALSDFVGRYGVRSCRIDVEAGHGELIATLNAFDEAGRPMSSQTWPMRAEPGDRSGELFLTLTAPARLPLQQRFTVLPGARPSHLLFRGRLHPRLESP
jgi:CubicO group peptidase (beta-lactamase class C family)